MPRSESLEFSSRAVAAGYDDVLVPIMFDPWAVLLRDEHDEWAGKTVLDLATGTGIVARKVVDWVGTDGSVIATDINGQMLELARRRCQGLSPEVHFVECPAHPLELDDDSIDVVVCQQGFQFFPDRPRAAAEVYRVLHDGGTVIATTWRPVTECELFGWICEALLTIDESGIAYLMRAPFDFMPESELEGAFRAAGFIDVELSRRARPLVLDRGPTHTVAVAYGTPIAPKLGALPAAKQAAFKEALSALARKRCTDGSTMGSLVTNVLTARKA